MMTDQYTVEANCAPHYPNATLTAAFYCNKKNQLTRLTGINKQKELKEPA